MLGDLIQPACHSVTRREPGPVFRVRKSFSDLVSTLAGGWAMALPPRSTAPIMGSLLLPLLLGFLGWASSCPSPFRGLPPMKASSASTIPLKSCRWEAIAWRIRIPIDQAVGWVTSISRASWWEDGLSLAFRIMQMARNHFCSSILVFWKIVFDSTLKLEWQAWQFQRP